ncbi:hypothetical protein HPB47_017967 [Ixodes persulcatus]|uniref:Uncharacterized protein n=1 Tax=Ixodes persulcatus TaxID=34615 RepID=A0AC60QNW7_IXOPE|nr:hypothetical protein HPB47_017967 [Ixodes persulcatus]
MGIDGTRTLARGVRVRSRVADSTNGRTATLDTTRCDDYRWDLSSCGAADLPPAPLITVPRSQTPPGNKLVRALLVSGAVYGINYLRLTATQREKLEVLNRSAVRVITGLPKITHIKELHKAAQVNTIEEIAQEMKMKQYNRLEKTWHGRIILETIGRRTWCIPSNQPSQPPWEYEPVVSLKPISMNQGEGHRKRHAAAAKKHLEDLGRLREQEDVEILYTDDNDERTAVAWLAESSSKKESKLAPMTPSTRTAELLAIQLAIEAHVEITNKHLETLWHRTQRNRKRWIARKQRLASLLPMNDCPIPPGFTRNAVCIW